MRQIALTILAGIVGLLTFGAGLASVVQLATTPDSLKTVAYVQRNGVTLEQAKSAEHIANANKTEAEARVIAGRGWLDMVGESIGLVVCSVVALAVTFGAVFLADGITRARREAG